MPSHAPIGIHELWQLLCSCCLHHENQLLLVWQITWLGTLQSWKSHVIHKQVLTNPITVQCSASQCYGIQAMGTVVPCKAVACSCCLHILELDQWHKWQSCSLKLSSSCLGPFWKLWILIMQKLNQPTKLSNYTCFLCDC